MKALAAARSAPDVADLDAADLLGALARGELRAAEPDPTAPDGWRIRPDVKAAILACFADRTPASWAVGPFAFRDRASLPPIDPGPDRRIVPGGRRGGREGSAAGVARHRQDVSWHHGRFSACSW